MTFTNIAKAYVADTDFLIRVMEHIHNMLTAFPIMRNVQWKHLKNSLNGAKRIKKGNNNDSKNTYIYSSTHTLLAEQIFSKIRCIYGLIGGRKDERISNSIYNSLRNFTFPISDSKSVGREMKYIKGCEQLSLSDLVETPKPTSPLYLKYQQTQDKFPNSIILIRIGDFYEIMGDNAAYVSEQLDLTLTGRLVGNGLRVSMCGFPYHITEKYIGKILNDKSVVVIEDNQEFYIVSHEEARKEIRNDRKKH